MLRDQMYDEEKRRKKRRQEDEALTIGGWDANGSFVPAATIVETVADSTGFSGGGDGSGFGGGGALGDY